MGKIAKVLVCGGRGVGKTSILEQLIYGNITLHTDFYPTIEDTYVATVDTGRGPRETLRLFDIGGVQGSGQLMKHYMSFPDGYILVYDPSQSESFDALIGIKTDIDKYKDKKEVSIIVLANIHNPINLPSDIPNNTDISNKSTPNSPLNSPNINQNLINVSNSQNNSPVNSPTKKKTMNFDTVISRAISWCTKERLRHCVVNAMERNTLYEPFVNLATKLYPPPNKSTFPLSKLTKTKNELHN